MDSEIDNGRHRTFNFAVNNLDSEVMFEKLDSGFDSRKGASKLDLVLEFVLRIVEKGSCRCYHAHENITQLNRSKLVAPKNTCHKSRIY